MRVKITVTKNKLADVARQLPDAALAIVQQVGSGIHSKAVAGAVIGPTGDFARGFEFDGGKRTSAGAYGEITNNVEYAPYVEFGTGARGQASNFPGKPDVSYSGGWAGMAARPTLTPAVEEGRREWKAEWRALRRRLRA